MSTVEEQQRKIGQQLLLINMIKDDNNRVLRGLMPKLTREDIVRWSSLDEAEVNRLIDACATLDARNRADNIANRLQEQYPNEKNALMYILFIYYRLASYAIELLEIFMDEAYCEKYAKEYYKAYCKQWPDFPVGEEFANGNEWRRIIRFYVEHFVDDVNTVRKMGFEWEVVSAMLEFTLTIEQITELEQSIKTKVGSN